MKFLFILLLSFQIFASDKFDFNQLLARPNVCSKNYSPHAKNYPRLLHEETVNYQTLMWQYQRAGQIDDMLAVKREVYDILKHGEIADSIAMYHGATAPHRILLPMEVEGVFKTAAEHSPHPHLSGANEEVAAFIVSELYGFNFVPLTIFRTIDGKFGTVQLYVRDSATGKLLDLHKEPWEREKLSFFDHLIGQTDRHDGNYHVTTEGYIVALDNSIAFSNNKSRNIPNPAIDPKYFQSKNAKAIISKMRNTPDDEVRKLLRSAIDRSAIEEFIENKNQILKQIDSF